MRTAASRSHDVRVERNTRIALLVASVISGVLGFVTVGGLATKNPTLFPPKHPAVVQHTTKPTPVLSPTPRPTPAVKRTAPALLPSTGAVRPAPLGGKQPPHTSGPTPKNTTKPSPSPSGGVTVAPPGTGVEVYVQVTPSPAVRVCQGPTCVGLPPGNTSLPEVAQSILVTPRAQM